jgi:tripartite-type tricarboxylate transporter receptor subunit TctC
MKQIGTIASILALSLPATTLAQAPSFSPSRPVVAVAPYEPGGPVDIEGRMYTKKATELTGQQFIMEYRTGAGTRIGVGYVARAVPDGHTLLITNASFTVFPALYKDLPFDTLKDFAPVSQMSIKTNVLVVRAAFPAKNFAEYVAYARANPGKVNFAMLGSGSTTHLVAAWLGNVTNTKVTLVPYKGGGPAMVDVVAGRVDAYTPALIAGMPHIKSGKVRPLGVITGSRSKLLPDLPTIAEQGAPGLEWLNWTGFLAPRAVPAATLARLNDIFDKVAKAPDIISLSETQGNVTVGGPSEPFAKLLAAETARWRKLAQDNNIKVEE